jgi:cytochrome c oxidase subunit 2
VRSIRPMSVNKISLATGLLAHLTLAGCAGAPAVLSPASPNAAMVSDLFLFLFAIAAVVFLVVEVLLFYSVIRFRRKKTDGMPTQIYGNPKLEIAWTVIPAIVLAVVFVLTWQTLNSLAAIPPNSLNIKVTGYQWWWQVEYPDLGAITANEIHVPAGQDVLFTLESKDVIHSFWVPELGGKMDMIPGRTNRLWLRPTKVGIYQSQCAEFCGTAHALMRLTVFVEPVDQFNAWVAQQKRPAQPPTIDLAKRGADEITQVGCQGCHAISGTKAQGKIGPDLTHLASRKMIAAGLLTFNDENLHTWISDPSAVKPGTKMPKLALTQEQIDAISAYLMTLK